MCNPARARESSGATAVAALITADSKIYVVSQGSRHFTVLDRVLGQCRGLEICHRR